MGIYIKGMEIPKSCYVCPFCDYVSARCDAVKGNPYTQESRYEKRDDFCPLVRVPPHGDLIDASEKIRVQMYDDEHEDFHTVEMTIDDLLSQSWVKAYAFPVIPASEEAK